MKRSKLNAALFLILIFCGGVVVGALSHKLYDASVVSARTEPQSPEKWRAEYVAEAKDRMSLRADQIERLNGILDQSRERYEILSKRYKPEMRQIHRDQMEQIRTMLDEDQRPQYEKWHEERRAKWRKSAESKKPFPKPGL